MDANIQAKHITMEATLTKADGTVIEYGVLCEWDAEAGDYLPVEDQNLIQRTLDKLPARLKRGGKKKKE